MPHAIVQPCGGEAVIPHSAGVHAMPPAALRASSWLSIFLMIIYAACTAGANAMIGVGGLR